MHPVQSGGGDNVDLASAIDGSADDRNAGQVDRAGGVGPQRGACVGDGDAVDVQRPAVAGANQRIVGLAVRLQRDGPTVGFDQAVVDQFDPDRTHVARSLGLDDLVRAERQRIGCCCGIGDDVAFCASEEDLARAGQTDVSAKLQHARSRARVFEADNAVVGHRTRKRQYLGISDPHRDAVQVHPVQRGSDADVGVASAIDGSADDRSAVQIDLAAGVDRQRGACVGDDDAVDVQRPIATGANRRIVGFVVRLQRYRPGVGVDQAVVDQFDPDCTLVGRGGRLDDLVRTERQRIGCGGGIGDVVDVLPYEADGSGPGQTDVSVDLQYGAACAGAVGQRQRAVDRAVATEDQGAGVVDVQGRRSAQREVGGAGRSAEDVHGPRVGDGDAVGQGRKRRRIAHHPPVVYIIGRSARYGVEPVGGSRISGPRKDRCTGGHCRQDDGQNRRHCSHHEMSVTRFHYSLLFIMFSDVNQARQVDRGLNSKTDFDTPSNDAGSKATSIPDG